MQLSGEEGVDGTLSGARRFTDGEAKIQAIGIFPFWCP
jgi:hypothetical protein